MSQTGRKADLLTRASWEFLKTFSVRNIRARNGWEAIERMQKKANAALDPVQNQYDQLQECWRQKLRLLGGDSASLDCSEFRPLRLSREEDWSDWLAWLLKTSKTGVLAEALFGSHVKRAALELKTPIMERERRTDDKKRRGDILLKWDSGIRVNIEVKVWDEQFEKTFETAQKLRGYESENDWYDYILIPEESLTEWENAAGANVREQTVYVISWKDVARGLRLCLWEEKESLVWRVWAWTFCSSVEERILHLGKLDGLRSDVSKLSMGLNWLDLLDFKTGDN